MAQPLIITDAASMRAWTRHERQQGHSVGLVPTMGALHEGHLTLAREAAVDCDRVIVSVFVNPTQFGPGEDYDAYPRTLDSDSKKLAVTGAVDVIFAPSEAEIYPLGANLTWVTVDQIGDHLCGSSRPGHFRGVTTIVARLFAICEPDVAVFGLKDAQQFFILKRMTAEMGFAVTLKGVPTVREGDGLAMSSRNRYLSPEERSAAPILYAALQEARDQIVERGVRDSVTIVAEVRERLGTEPLCRIDYVQLVDTQTLQPLHNLASGSKVLLASAAFFGSARLIDNAIVDVP
jgi:pantoate--beta-alanine ligase